jgi:hypothetical protein
LLGGLQALDQLALTTHHVPLVGEGRGELQDLDRIEGLLQDQEPIAVPEPVDRLLPGIVRIGRADDDLELGVLGPQLLDRAHAVPAGRHANVHEGHRVRALLGQRGLEHCQALLSLQSALELEVHARGLSFGGLRARGPAHESGPGVRQEAGVLLRGDQDFLEILVDRRVVVDQQDALQGLQAH